MTTPQSNNSEVRRVEQAPTAALRESLPYAQPIGGAIPGAVDAMLIDAIRANAGPYVPAPWRSRPEERSEPVFIQQVRRETLEVVEAEVETELPWIDAFAEDKSAPASHGIEDAHDESVAPAATDATAYESPAEDSSPAALFADESAATPSVLDMLRIEQPVDFAESASVIEVPEAAAQPVEVSEDAENWPMAEAGDAMRALADDLMGRESGQLAEPAETSASRDEQVDARDTSLPSEAAAEGEATTQPTNPPAPLPMWSDDDMMDIMPVAVTRNSSEQEHWAAQARREDVPDSSGEAVAQVLESLARRARGGELPVHGYAADMGDAAVLAAALASLLGVRR